MTEKNYIAVDLGAESGRVMLGEIGSDKMSIREIHRFANSPVKENGSMRWDFENIMAHIKTGLAKAVKENKNITSMAVDTWGVDFGLLDKNGDLLENPYHYRDSRTENIFEKAFEVMFDRDIYDNTGIQLMPINSLFQLFAYKRQRPDIFNKADKLLFMPDLIAYHLTGKLQAEYTIASTSQMLDMRTGNWSENVLSAFDIPRKLLSDIFHPGSVIGKIKGDIAKEIGCEPFDVVAVGNHDTASAVAGIPANQNSNWAYLSSGTWSLMGCEAPTPTITDKSFEYQFTNEGGVGKTIRLLKNITGLWIVQQCRQFWAEQGQQFSYSELTEMAENAEAGSAVIDVNHQPFLSPGNMPNKINDYLKATNQAPIDDKGLMIRVILESLAVKYAEVISMLQEISSQSIDVLHIVGGGIKNSLLNQLTANAAGKTVITGPAEATVVGNILVQAIASGQINSIEAGRELTANSFELNKYQPQ